VITATEAGVEGARALLDEITDALALLEGRMLDAKLGAN
jgi:hypothetical protein